MSEKKEVSLPGNALDTLIALVERGPLGDGDVPSKAGRDYLLEHDLAAKIIVNGADGFQAATYKGAGVYREHFKGVTIAEATINRKAALVTQRKL